MAGLLILLAGVVVSSRVEKVVVYPNQVLVTRTAPVVLESSGEILLSGLPGALDDNSVRIKAPGLRIGEVRIRRGYLAEPTPEVQRRERRVRQLEDTVAALDAEAAVLKAREDFLASVKLGAPELIARELQQGRVAPDAWRSALGFVADELTRVKQRSIILARVREEKNRELEAARQEYQAARSAIEDRKEVRFDYSGRAGEYRLEVTYVVPGAARWEPAYELRSSPDANRLDLACLARLTQHTGEDWDNTRVVLSTMTPVSGAVAPEPQPWYLSLLEYRAPKAAARFSEAVMAPGGVAEADMAPQTEVVETGLALQYVVPGRISLASGEPAKRIELYRAELDAAFDHYALPRQSQQAFLTCQLVNSSELLLLAGSASTFVNDEYTGSTRLPTVAPQESVNISFGVDERVKVSRELVRSFKSRTGLFGRTERLQLHYRTTIENYHAAPVTVRLLEQVPVSQQSDIRVTVTRTEPEPLDKDENTGTFTWKPQIASRQRFTVDIEFTVEYPAGRQVLGLF